MPVCTSRDVVCDRTCENCPRGNKRFLFLDIDGVLNSSEFHKVTAANPPAVWPTELIDVAVTRLDPVAIARLNRFVGHVTFILSSMWRLQMPLADIQTALRIRGFNGLLAGQTPDIPYKWRGDEISAWLEAHTGVELAQGERAWPKFVILDDNSDMTILKGRLVQTDQQIGLQDADVDRAMALLGVHAASTATR